MDSSQYSSHDVATAKKKLNELFFGIADSVSSKTGSVPSFSNGTDKNRETPFFIKQAIFEDPSPEQAFLVILCVEATSKYERFKVSVEIGFLSRTVQYPDTLPAHTDVREMLLASDPEPLILAKDLRSLSSFIKGPWVSNIMALVAETLKAGGDFDVAVGEARANTKRNIATAKTLGEMERLGWEVREESREPDSNGVMAYGNKVIYAFRDRLTVQQAIALHEAINAIIGDDRNDWHRKKVVTYRPG